MKLSSLQNYLAREKITVAFFVHPDPVITYFTQMELSHGYLLIGQKNCSLWLTALDKKPHLPAISVNALEKDWEKKFQNSRIRKVAVNKTALSVKNYEKIQELFPKAQFVDISKKINELRQEKTIKELKLIEKACSITANAFNAFVNHLPSGNLQTEQDVALFLERQIRTQDAELAFPTIAAMGKNAAIPHHKTSTTKLTRGFLLVDFGARYRNYCADMTRVVFLGIPTQAERKWYDLLLQAQLQAINSIKEGITYQILDVVARRHLGKAAQYFIHSLGHGIGTEVHESPVFSDAKENVRKKIPFTIEPGIYFPGKFGLRIEDTLYWDGKKIQILTHASKDFTSVNFKIKK